MLALNSGAFHASHSGSDANAWLGSGQMRYLWPEGYHVQFNPVRLTDTTGRVVAYGGERVAVGGGGSADGTGRQTFLVESSPSPLHLQGTYIDPKK
jgi:hypothetical protein